MEFYLDIKCSKNFKDAIDQWLKIEKSLIKKGLVKIHNDNKEGPRPAYNSDKAKFWAKNKNIVNDGVVDAQNVKIAQPIVKIAKVANNRNNLTTNQGNPQTNLGNQPSNTQQEEPKNRYLT